MKQSRHEHLNGRLREKVNLQLSRYDCLLLAVVERLVELQQSEQLLQLVQLHGGSEGKGHGCPFAGKY